VARKRKRAAPDQDRPLTARQERFVSEYLIDLNGTAAYRRAGYAAKTDNAAAASASALLRNRKVAAAIAAGQAERLARCQMSADEVLAELAVLGRSNLDHYTIDSSGMVALAEAAPRSAIRAVASIKRRRVERGESGDVEVTTEIRLWDKPGSLRTLAQRHGLLKNKVELTGKDGAPIEFVEVPADADADAAAG
jgi:phage terminase small subunit